MKITCEYCGTIYDDSEELCPGCGASHHEEQMGNSAPKTIEELKQWYEARNLPPSDVTRFFIGENYKRPKAFGIYKEGTYFIVYKNKADGSRAVRYKGTDEAFAVNELYMRLKEEILNQKAHNADMSDKAAWSKAVGGDTAGTLHKRLNKPLQRMIILSILLAFGGFAFTVAGAFMRDDAANCRNFVGVFATAHTFELIAAFAAIALAYVLMCISAISIMRDKDSKKQNGTVSNIITGIMAIFGSSIVAAIGIAIAVVAFSLNMTNCDRIKDYIVNGYYVGLSEDTDETETLWYREGDRWKVYYDSDWHDTYEVPYIYKHGEKLKFSEFRSIPSKNFLGSADEVNPEELGYLKYTDSDLYNDQNYSYSRGYYKCDDKVYYCLNETKFSFYEYDEDDGDWDSCSADSLPVELQHASLAGDFYYTPEWNSETQISDFEDTAVYQHQIEKEQEAAERAAKAEQERAQSGYNSYDDDDYNWDSNDSWDSGDTDWDSDW